MSPSRRWFLFAGLGALSLIASYSVTKRLSPKAITSAGLEPPNDSILLQRAGFGRGSHMSAYVFVSSKCGVCTQKDVKAAIASVREQLRKRYGSDFARIKIVGVAVDSDLAEGLSYFRGLGLERFDELDVGGGWLNEQLAQHIWRGGVSEAMVPQIIIATRQLESERTPSIRLSLHEDSIVRVVRGGPEILRWVHDGTPLRYSATIERPGIVP